MRDDLAAAAELWKVIGDLDLDVLHAHTPKAGVLGRVVGRLRGVPVVGSTCHGLWATRDDRLVKRVIVYAIEAVAAVFSDFELYQNAEDRATMRFAVRSSVQPSWVTAPTSNGSGSMRRHARRCVLSSASVTTR